MPTHDRPVRRPRRKGPIERQLGVGPWFEGAIRRRRRDRDRDKDDGGIPVEPNRPNSLSGGAAAELEFDD